MLADNQQIQAFVGLRVKPLILAQCKVGFQILLNQILVLVWDVDELVH